MWLERNGNPLGGDVKDEKVSVLAPIGNSAERLANFIRTTKLWTCTWCMVQRTGYEWNTKTLPGSVFDKMHCIAENIRAFASAAVEVGYYTAVKENAERKRCIRTPQLQDDILRREEDTTEI